MTWSYASGSPGSVDLDWVRLRIGDTDTSDQLLQDEEIEALVTSEGNRHMAAVVACETIAAKFARHADKTVGKLSISMSQAAERYLSLADRLRSDVTMDSGSGGPYAGGISRSDKEADETDTDRVSPAFSVGQFDPHTSVDWSE